MMITSGFTQEVHLITFLRNIKAFRFFSLLYLKSISKLELKITTVLRVFAINIPLFVSNFFFWSMLAKERNKLDSLALS